MSIGNYLYKFKNFSDFKYSCSKIPNKGNWKKNKVGKDVCFELLTKIIIQKHPLFQNEKIKSVYHESEIPLRVKKKINYPLNIGDNGIDLLIEYDGEKFSSVQCKFISDKSSSLKIGGEGGLSTFFNLSNVVCKNIKNLYIFSTSSKLPRKINLTPKNSIFIMENFFNDLDKENSLFKWEDIRKTLSNRKIKYTKTVPRQFQKKIISKLSNFFINNDRGLLFLPCGTGKTLIGYWLSEKLKSKKIIILVPNLALITQTLKTWTNEIISKKNTFNWLIVCSDKDVKLNSDPFVLSSKELPFETTTDNQKILDFLEINKNNNFFIISTYNSAYKISDISKKNKIKFDFAIFDEAHRTVGTKDKLFSKLIHSKNINIKKRLFMTATKRTIPNFKDIYDMSNNDIYGKIAYEMSFKNAIEHKENILSDYRFISMGIDKEEIYELWQKNPQVKSKNLDSTTMKYLSSLILLFNIWDKYNLKKGITFHNTIEGSERFKDIAEQYQKYLNKKNDIQFFNISSRSKYGTDKEDIINDFKNDFKSIITNARCLVEGVDVPSVDAIVFVDTKRSRTDIVQAIGRCLRRSKGKKYGYVIVPFIFDKKEKKEEFLKSEYSEIIKVIRILALYDKTFYEDIKLQTKTNKNYGKKVSIEVITNDVNVDLKKLNNDIKIENYNKTGPLNFLTFEEAKLYVREKGIRTVNQYIEMYKKNLLDPDLPASIYQCYKNEGFTTWSEFVGNGNLSSHERQQKTINFKTFTKIVRDELKIEYGKDYYDIPLERKLELSLPSNPERFYKSSGEITHFSWGEILGTGYIATFKRKYKPLEDFIKYIQKFNFPSNTIYEHWVTNGQSSKSRSSLIIKTAENFIKKLPNPPLDIPKDIRAHYGQKGKIKIDVNKILGIKSYEKINEIYKEFKYWPFKKSKDYVHKLNLNQYSIIKKVPGAGVANKWRSYCRGFYNLQKKPDQIPFDPDKVYNNFGWIGWNDWVGGATYDFLSYENAKKFLKNIKIYEFQIPKEYLIKNKKKKIRNIIKKVSFVDMYGRYLAIFDAYKENKLKHLEFNTKLPRVPYRFYKDKRPWDWEDFLGIKK